MAKPEGLPDHDWDAQRAACATTTTTRDSTTRRSTQIHRGIRKVMDEFPEAMTVGEIWVSRQRALRRVHPAGRASPGIQLPACQRPSSRRSPCGRRSRTPSPPSPRSAVFPPGRCPITTSNVRSPATAEAEIGTAARAGDGPGRAGTARCRLHLQRRRTRTAERRSCPTTPCRTRCGNAPVTPNVVATDAECRCRGKEPHRRSDSPPASSTWLPMPPEWATLTVEAQLEDVESMLSLYRTALELRPSRPEFSGAEIDWYGSPPGCLAFRRRGGLICALTRRMRLSPCRRRGHPQQRSPGRRSVARQHRCVADLSRTSTHRGSVLAVVAAAVLFGTTGTAQALASESLGYDLDPLAVGSARWFSQA